MRPSELMDVEVDRLNDVIRVQSEAILELRAEVQGLKEMFEIVGRSRQVPTLIAEIERLKKHIASLPVLSCPQCDKLEEQGE